MTRKNVRILAGFVFTLLALTCTTASAEFKMLDRIAAVVDNDVVMNSELESRLGSIYQRLQQSGTEPPPPEVLRPQVLERLILERIQLNMGIRGGIRISDTELNNALSRVAASQGLSMDQLVDSIHQQGTSLNEVKADLRDEMIINQVQQGQVNRRIYISEQEIANFLASEEGRMWSSADLNLGHILIPLSAGADKEAVQQAQDRAQSIIDRVAAGEDFRRLAIANSAGQNALEGGNLGWRKAAQLPEIFTLPLQDLEPGETTAPIRSDAGLHILKLYERRGADRRMIRQKHARHILLKPNQIRSDTETEQQLAEIRQQILDGGDFAALAKANSEDIASALSGGDLGWSLPGKFVPEFEQVINSLEPGTVSEPFRTQYGWHIVEVTEEREEDFSEEIKRNQAENILRQRKFQEELQIWLQEMRDEAFVEIKA